MTQFVYIYTLIDPITGLVRYIGKTNNLTTRLRSHLKNVKREKNHRTNWINAIIQKGLKPLIEEVDCVPTESWQYWERFYISLFKSWGFSLTNSAEGGIGRSNYSPTIETRLKMGLARKGKKHSEETLKVLSKKGKERMQTLENRTKASLQNKGKIVSESTKTKLSLAVSGENHPFWGKSLSEDHKEKIGNWHRGKNVSEDTRKKLREINLGKIISDETRKRFSESRMGNKNALGMKHSKETKDKIAQKSKEIWAKRKANAKLPN